MYEGYGLTEISGIATTYREGQPRKPGSVGLPLGDTELRVVSPEGLPVAGGEVGEVQFRGASVIPGYWRGAGNAADDGLGRRLAPDRRSRLSWTATATSSWSTGSRR